jgi:hypothetical protein
VTSVEDSIRVCPRCGVAAEENDYCSGCGLQLNALVELPTRSAWEAERAQSAIVPVQPRRPIAPMVPARVTLEPLLHPSEQSRLALALLAAALAVLGLVVILITAAVASPTVLVGFVLFLSVVIGSIWLGQQLLRARLLGRSLKVAENTFPQLQAVLDDVASTLDYRRRVDLYVVDHADAPINLTSYLGTRIIVMEGSLAAELLDPGRRPHLLFILGRSIGGLKAKHARLDLVVLLLQAANALRFVSVFLLPWYRATTYSGDQIGMVCCGDPAAALEATRRLLVGKDLAAGLGAGNVLPQALLVQRRFLPRLMQLLAPEPHLTNRYANLVCFARYHDPDLWEEVSGSMEAEQLRVVEQLWQRSPHRRRLVAA